MPKADAAITTQSVEVGDVNDFTIVSFTIGSVKLVNTSTNLYCDLSNGVLMG